MDVWPMSVKRPDAHMGKSIDLPVKTRKRELTFFFRSPFVEPPNDCLHWCRTGVQNYWNMLLIHMMLAESRNKDYGV
jgi:hypothetical protein